jgi:2-oxoglutarate ferredoxin oxidoreductase subunit gamma
MKNKAKNNRKPHLQGKPRGCREEMLFAGFGGQGIMFMGKLLAQAGLLAGKHVTWMPSYGAEVRGGTAYSMTKMSDHEIASPVVVNPDILVVMNKPSLVKYGSIVKKGGILISNRSLIGNFKKPEGVKTFNLPMTKLASDIGSTKCANMIALGVIAKRSRYVTLRNIINALSMALKNREELFILNKKVLEKGYRAG